MSATFQEKFLQEYHKRIQRCIRFGFQDQLKKYLSLGVDPNWDYFGEFDPFLKVAFFYKNSQAIKILLDAGCAVQFDSSQINCSMGYHSNALLQYLSFYHIDVEFEIIQSILVSYSQDKSKQLQLLEESCSSCGSHAMELIFYTKSHNYQDPEMFKTIVRFIEIGCTIPSSLVDDLFSLCISYHESTILLYLLNHFSIPVYALQVIKAIDNDNRINHIKSRTKKFTLKPYSQSILQQLIHRLISVYGVDTKEKTIFHYAVDRGDTDILLDLLTKSNAVEMLAKKDKDQKTVLHYAIDKGCLYLSLQLFYFIINHAQNEWNEENKELPNISLFWYENTMKKASKQFYDFLQAEIVFDIQHFKPTMEVEKQEKMVRKIKRMAEDFYHPSGIGFPDEDIKVRNELLGLDSTEKIVESIQTWSETNPLAAMRWYYVEQQKSNCY